MRMRPVPCASERMDWSLADFAYPDPKFGRKTQYYPNNT
jgi:hypothetical protein